MRIDIENLDFINPFLRAMVIDVESHFGVEFTVTSLYRIGDFGVHGALPLRGIDLRCRSTDLGAIVSAYVNSKYMYDPSRPEKRCCLAHGEGSNYHLHLQMHPNTEAF